MNTNKVYIVTDYISGSSVVDTYGDKIVLNGVYTSRENALKRIAEQVGSKDIDEIHPSVIEDYLFEIEVDKDIEQVIITL